MNYDAEAKRLLQDIYHTGEEGRELLIAEYLLKTFRAGYLDGTDSGWAAIQDSMPQSELISDNRKK